MRRKLKEKQRKFLRNKKAFIFATVLCMGVGFAFLTSNLTITGNTSVSGNKWNVYFTNVEVTEGSVDATVVPTTTGTNTTSLDYTVTLDKPGDFYEFTVDAVNNGTIDAMIQSVNMTSLDTDVEKYLSYTATYLDGTALAQNDGLEAGDSTTYKVRVEFKKNIQASDLSEESTSLTLTFGVNYVQSNIKFPKSFIKLVKDNALSDKTIDFKEISSDTNGKGLYLRTGTENNSNPIYYYRGDVKNNNVLFAGFCWKIVRTTETGGTKLIYNGLPKEEYYVYNNLEEDDYVLMQDPYYYYENNSFVFNQNTKEWVHVDGENSENYWSFSLKESGNYVFNFDISSNDSEFEIIVHKDDEVIQYVYNENSGRLDLNNISTENNITVEYSGSNVESFKFSLAKGEGDTHLVCDNREKVASIGESAFSSQMTSLSSNGYMYGDSYTAEIKSVNNTYTYGNSFTYNNGIYTLSNTSNGADATHHYTCLSSEATCSNIFYIFRKTTSTGAYGISLSNGKSIEDALEDMQKNEHDSTIKEAIDDWFEESFITYFTNKNKDYHNYLEDTVWCNDRQFDIANNGLNPNGGEIGNVSLSYDATIRLKEGTPSLSCIKNNSFTVEKSATGNGALTYPVGLLTADEIMLAGLNTKSVYPAREDNYLYANNHWWSMTPSYYTQSQYTSNYMVTQQVYLFSDLSQDSYSIRPSISVSPSLKIKNGTDGTSSSPYEFLID